MPLHDYVWPIALLASVVITIQIIGTTHSGICTLVTALALAGLVLRPSSLGTLTFAGVSLEEQQQLVATVAVLPAAIMATNFMPVRATRQQRGAPVDLDDD